MADIKTQLAKLATLDFKGMYNQDFICTWDKTYEQLQATLVVADIIRALREDNISPRIFDSGLAVSLFRDNSTRTRFSFASACNLLGLAVQDLDEGKSQIAHGETVRETVNMVGFMADVMGIRDDMFFGKGNAFMHEVSDALREGYEEGSLEQRPAVVNLQCDMDHPTQTMADLNHLIHTFGGMENLKGKKLVMSWAYSPSYGKPLSVPQGIIGLMTSFGMDVVLAHPKGYDVMPQAAGVARIQSIASGGSFTKTDNMAQAFADADVVYPKSWAPFKALKKRSRLFDKGDQIGIALLEDELLEQNAQHRDWECTEELMATTKDGAALYMHCLPADISSVSCEQGEVAASVFERYRPSLYQQASHKPYIIAAMIMLSKVADPSLLFARLAADGASKTRRLLG